MIEEEGIVAEVQGSVAKVEILKKAPARTVPPPARVIPATRSSWSR